MRIKITKTSPDAIIPTHGSDLAAGWDLYANGIKNEDGIQIYPGEAEKIGTGIAMQIPAGYVGLIIGRSGMAFKRGLRLSNSVGVLNSDFTGEIMCSVYNDSTRPRDIKNGDRIAQLIIVPIITQEYDVVPKLDDTVRGSNGFGSTGR